jgi:hypothetical protein
MELPWPRRGFALAAFKYYHEDNKIQRWLIS